MLYSSVHVYTAKVPALVRITFGRCCFSFFSPLSSDPWEAAKRKSAGSSQKSHWHSPMCAISTELSMRFSFTPRMMMMMVIVWQYKTFNAMMSHNLIQALFAEHEKRFLLSQREVLFIVFILFPTHNVGGSFARRRRWFSERQSFSAAGKRFASATSRS